MKKTDDKNKPKEDKSKDVKKAVDKKKGVIEPEEPAVIIPPPIKESKIHF